MGDDFSERLEKAAETVAALQEFLAQVRSNTAAPPAGFARDDFIEAAETQIKSLSEAIKKLDERG